MAEADMTKPKPQVVTRFDLVRAYFAGHFGALKYKRAFQDVERYCLFVGYPRSGHSLVGSLLNAHPLFVISHELDVLVYVRAGFNRSQLFALTMKRDRQFVDSGAEWSDYSYAVPGQWQGRFKAIKVIGDKKGGMTSLRVLKQPDLIRRLAETVRVPLALIHIVRNPFDNIATMHRRSGKDLSACTIRYFEHCRGSALAMNAVTEPESCTIRHEDFVADPAGSLQILCRFLGHEGPPDFIDACAALVRPATKQTRHTAPWTDAHIAAVYEGMREFAFLDGYNFES